MCSNGKIPNLKLAAALSNRHAAKAIYHHSELCMLWAPQAGGKIRMVATRWRDLAFDEYKREIGLRKAWGLQKYFRLAESGLGHFKRLQDFLVFMIFRGG